HIANIERRRGKVLAFAHNFHLQHSMARWQLGAEELAWWPAGAHLDAMLGQRYAVIGSAIGQSQRHGINAPEPGTLEARVTNSPSAAKFVLTQRGRAISRDEITAIPTRGSSTKNSTYFPLTPQSVADFDCLAVLRSID
ncbi:MAG TPA: erythromycin esterase family protein, partial [Pirellulales bacterium]|nr:erythromycin esterase family protein [Pirellulales bacterium]